MFGFGMLYRLMEDLDIGWAWWPLKKIESIAGPVSVVKTDDYQTLLDYWSGSGPNVSAEFGKATLMDIAEGFEDRKLCFSKRCHRCAVQTSLF